MTKHYLYRWGFFLAGLIIMALGISMTIKGQRLGISPWDVLHVGLYRKFGLSIGSWNIITGLFIVFFVSIFLREWPNLGTWINILTIGVFIDLFNWLLPEFTTIWGQTIILFLGLLYQDMEQGFMFHQIWEQD